MLDSAEDVVSVKGEERGKEEYDVDGYHSGKHTSAFETATHFADSDVKTQTGRPAPLSRPEEVSRFFSNATTTITHSTTNGVRLPPFAETFANDSAIGSWPTSTVTGTNHQSETSVCVDSNARRDVRVAMQTVRGDGSGKQDVLGHDVDMESKAREYGFVRASTVTQGTRFDGLIVGASNQQRDGNTQDGACDQPSRTEGFTLDICKAINSPRKGSGVEDLLDSISKPAQRSRVKVS